MKVVRTNNGVCRCTFFFLKMPIREFKNFIPTYLNFLAIRQSRTRSPGCAMTRMARWPRHLKRGKLDFSCPRSKSYTSSPSHIWRNTLEVAQS